MEQEKIISVILDKIKQHNLFNGIVRYQYLPYNVDAALEIIESIGKSRNPKFCIDDENRFTYENLIRWCHCDSEMKCLDPNTKKIISGNLKRGIYIAGNTGSGKSWALDIIAAYCTAYNFQIDFGDVKSNLYWENVRTDAICSEFTEKGTFEKFKNRPILGIQDLGAEPTESVYMGNRVNVLRQILENRGDRTDTLTFISSNLPINHKFMIDKYNDRVVSRLNEMCNYFEIQGEDRRMR